MYRNNKTKKNKVIKCNQKYALCSAAPCVINPINKKKATCKCFLKNGINYSYGKKNCNNISSYKNKNKSIEYVYSTFSPVLKTNHKYKRILCPAKYTNLNCMNKKCTIDVHDKKRPICECDITNNHGEKWSTWVKNKNKNKNKCNIVSGSSTKMTTALQKAIKK